MNMNMKEIHSNIDWRFCVYYVYYAVRVCDDLFECIGYYIRSDMVDMLCDMETVLVCETNTKFDTIQTERKEKETQNTNQSSVVVEVKWPL